MQSAQLYNRLKQQLDDLEARRILKDVAGLDWSDLITRPEQKIPAATLTQIDTIIQRRHAGEPLSRIMGMREFWGMSFDLGPDTLDPRPDTEILVERALKAHLNPQTILDLGTGSGCILLALLSALPQARGTGVDQAQGALDTAQKNAQKHGLAGRAQFIRSDWFENIEEQFDLIVSNPPYIANQDITNLTPEVRNHDPILALDGGEDGFDCYKIIFSKVKNYLLPGGRALFEIGAGQCGYILRLAENYGLTVIESFPDLAGIPRVVEISCGDK